MAEGSDRRQWAHTSCLLAMIANVNRDPKKTRAFRSDDFNPYSDAGRKHRRGIPVRADNIHVLKALLRAKTSKARQ